MTQRLQIKNGTHFIEWGNHPTGKMQAQAFRKSHASFARRKIRQIARIWNDAIECGTVYERA
jgi:hypothetical protein